jgi:hypothetical protein
VRSAGGNNGDGPHGRRRSVNPSSDRLLSPGEFFGRLRKSLRSRLPQPYEGFESVRGRGRLIKFHFGHSELHYEVWHHTGAGKLEVGLHFEGAPEVNQRAFDFFRLRMVEIKARLPRAELEPWDRGWSRLYETLPAAHLDEHLVSSAVERLAVYVTTLQPLVEQFLEPDVRNGVEVEIGHLAR